MNARGLALRLGGAQANVDAASRRVFLPLGLPVAFKYAAGRRVYDPGLKNLFPQATPFMFTKLMSAPGYQIGIMIIDFIREHVLQSNDTVGFILPVKAGAAMRMHGFRRTVWGLVAIGMAVLALAWQTAASAETVTQPLQIYGLGQVWAVAYSPDGRRLAIVSSNTIHLYDTQTKGKIRIITGHESWITSIAFSPDGTCLLTGSNDQTAKLWNAATGAEIRTFVGHTGGVRAVAFSPDGATVVTGSSDKTARIWSAATGKGIYTLSGHTAQVNGVAFSPDGSKVLTGADDKTAKLWNAATGKKIRTFSRHSGGVVTVAFSPDGSKVLTGSRDKTSRIWNASSGDCLETLSGHSGEILAVAFSPDGSKALTGSKDKTAKLWKTSSGSKIRTLTGHTDRITAVAFSPDGSRALTGSSDRTARVWEVATGTQLDSFSGPILTYQVTFSKDGQRVITGSGDIWIWDRETATSLRQIPLAAGGLVACSPDDSKFLIGLEAGAQLLDATTGDMLAEFSVKDEDHEEEVEVGGFAFSPDSRKILLAVNDYTNDEYWIEILDMDTGWWARAIANYHTSFDSVTMSPDGSKVLTGSWEEAELWDADTGALLHIFPVQSGLDWVEGVSFSPDGSKALTSSSDGAVKIWDTATGALIHTLADNNGKARAIACSPNGSKVLTGSDAGSAKLWDMATGQLIRSFKYDDAFIDSEVSSVAFSPDGSKVLVGTLGGLSILWNTHGNAKNAVDPAAWRGME